LIRRIRELLYEQGFTISGARNRLEEVDVREDHAPVNAPVAMATASLPTSVGIDDSFDFARLRGELRGVLDILRAS
jgi:hypothetical protein